MAFGPSLRSVIRLLSTAETHETLLARKPLRLVTVAMANRAARAIWAIMVRGEVYRMPALGPLGSPVA